MMVKYEVKDTKGTLNYLLTYQSLDGRIKTDYKGSYTEVLERFDYLKGLRRHPQVYVLIGDAVNGIAEPENSHLPEDYAKKLEEAEKDKERAVHKSEPSGIKKVASQPRMPPKRRKEK